MKVSLNIAVVCVTLIILAVISSITWIAVVHDGQVADTVIVALTGVIAAFATGLASVGQAVIHSLGGAQTTTAPVTVTNPASVNVSPPVTVEP